MEGCRSGTRSEITQKNLTLSVRLTFLKVYNKDLKVSLIRKPKLLRYRGRGSGGDGNGGYDKEWLPWDPWKIGFSVET